MEIDGYLSKEQQKYKSRLKWRVLRSPKLWARNDKQNISDELEDQIISMLILKMNDIGGVIDEVKSSEKYPKQHAHNEANIRIGDFKFWNSNYNYAHATFSIDNTDIPEPRSYKPSRKLALCFKDLMKLVEDYETKITDDPIQQAVAKVVMDQHL